MRNACISIALDFPERMMANRGTISLVSGMMSLIFGLVVLSLVRREGVLRDEKWVKPFAYTFFVLAVNSFIRALMRMHETGWISSFPYDEEVFKVIEVIRTLCSGLTNYLFLYVGLWLVDIEGGRRDKILGRIKVFRSLKLKENLAKYLTLGIFLLAAGASNLKDEGGQSKWWASLPDTFFSASVLYFVGRTLYHNIGVRRDRLMALIALYSSILYAFAELFRGLIPAIERYYGTSLPALMLAFILIAMVLKCGLFFSGYGLMLLISTSTAGVRTLFRSITHGKSEYLENNGVVMAIRNALGASRVELYIKLPGTSSNEIACYKYPSGKDERTGEASKPIIAPFDPRRTYGYVMSTGQKLTYRLTNRPDLAPLELLDRFSVLSSILAVPVLFHKAVIGCLKVVIDDGRVNEADFQNMDRYATLISPTVQAYRQVEALNQLSQRLAHYQIEQSEYNLDYDVNQVAQIAHDILAPVATGIIIEAGFSTYTAQVVEDRYKKAVGDRLLGVSSTETTTVGGEEITYLPKNLEVSSRKVQRSEQSNGGGPRQEERNIESGQSLGRLILVTKEAGQGTEPTLATGFFYKEAVSNVITDSLLDFTRGYFTQVTNRLSVRLSSINEASLSDWAEQIDAAAKEAGLCWAVASQPNSDELLDPSGQSRFTTAPEEKWIQKEEGLWLCSLKPFHKEITHVIRVTLIETNQTMWLGVKQPKFGRELDYVSPWYVFVRILVRIADSALRRLTVEEQRERIEKEVSEFHGLATVAITTGTVIHEIANQVQEILWPITMLEDAIRRKTLKGNEIHRDAIFSLRDSARHIEELTRLFAGVIKPDSRRPSSLVEAIRYAESLLHDSIDRLHIKLVIQVSPFYSVDVPFYVAAFIMVNLISNAKNALKKIPDSGREIQIVARDTANGILCEVSDNGPGIPQHMVKQIFEPGNKSDGAGSGLGLYLSARSIRENRGHLELTHHGPNPNTTFTIHFPKPREE